MGNRKQFTAEFKARVAVAALKGDMTINKLSSEFGVHPTQVSQWKQRLLSNSKEIFSGRQEKEAGLHQQEKDQLYRQIGQQAVELEWLKKRLDISVNSK